MLRSALARAGLAALVATALLGTGALVLRTTGHRTIEAAGPLPQPAAEPVAAISAAKGDVVPWQQPLTVTVEHGTLTAVTVIDQAGTPVDGLLTPRTWTSTTTLVPRTSYAVHVALLDEHGKASSYDRTVRTAAPTRELHATVAPDGGTYGIGQPVIVRFNHAVKSVAARRAVMARLSVTSTPAVEGAWRWYNSYEVHYRGPAYWRPGTRIDVRADLSRLQLPGSDMWGAEKPATGGMTIGRSLVAVVDVTAHTMTVTRDGKVVRVMKVSTGRVKYPTKGGVHIVLKREKIHIFNSATVGIPTASPDGYYESLPWSVRISNGGAFVHTNTATIRYQGRLNVSHGCVNASPTDAQWFYENSMLGDIVDVVHAAIGPTKWDAGMADWNYTWAQWQAGNIG